MLIRRYSPNYEKLEKRGVCVNVKIHIVQKGDTLWELAEQYDVDFAELKKVNSQLSSPDMIMPGMKVKIPSSKKQVKKETEQTKEEKKENHSPKPIGMLEEDDGKKAEEIKGEHTKNQNKEKDQLKNMKKMPEIKQINMQMPLMEQQKKDMKQPEKLKSKHQNKQPKNHQQQMNEPQMLPDQQPMAVMPVCCCIAPCPQHFINHQQGVQHMQGLQMNQGKHMNMNPSYMHHSPSHMNSHKQHKATNCSCQGRKPEHMYHSIHPYQHMRYDSVVPAYQTMNHPPMYEDLSKPLNKDMHSQPMPHPKPPLFPMYSNDHNEEG